MIATSCEDERNAEKLAEDLQDTAEQTVDDAAAPVEVESVSVGYDRVLEARALGTTPGKLNLVQKLRSEVQDPDSIDVQEWLTKPVKEIMKAIKTEKRETKSEDTPSDSGSVSGDTGSSSPGESMPAEEQSDGAAKPEKAPKPAKQAGSPSGDGSSQPNGKAAPKAEKETAQRGSSKPNPSVNASTDTKGPSEQDKGKPNTSKSEKKTVSPQKENGQSNKSAGPDQNKK